METPLRAEVDSWKNKECSDLGKKFRFAQTYLTFVEKTDIQKRGGGKWFFRKLYTPGKNVNKIQPRQLSV